jgi:hypothetical protein
MSTRALYTFTDAEASWNVYKHSDGYPTGAARTLTEAAKWFAWQLPRFEADEFATAFCAAGKAYKMIALAEGQTTVEAFQDEDKEYGKYSHGGNTRLMPQGNPPEIASKHCTDIEYRYEITGKANGLHITCWNVSAWDNYSEKVLFKGTLAKFVTWAAEGQS